MAILYTNKSILCALRSSGPGLQITFPRLDHRHYKCKQHYACSCYKWT